MEVYRIKGEDMTQLDEHALDKEINLENRLVRTEAAQIGGIDILYIGRQGTLASNGIFDILGVDKDGNIVIIELKRDKPPRGVITQALEYASDLRDVKYYTMNERYRNFILDEHQYDDEEITQLQQAHANYFGLEEPLSKKEFNDRQRIIIVGTEYDDEKLLQMVDFLREYGIEVLAVEYNTYRDNKTDAELLTTNAIRHPLSVESKPTGITDGKTWHLKTKTNEETGELLRAVVDELEQVESISSILWNQEPYIAFEDQNSDRPVIIFTRKTLFRIRLKTTVDDPEERDAIANRLGIPESAVERTTNNRDQPRLRIRIKGSYDTKPEEIRKEIDRVLSLK